MGNPTVTWSIGHPLLFLICEELAYKFTIDPGGGPRESYSLSTGAQNVLFMPSVD